MVTCTVCNGSGFVNKGDEKVPCRCRVVQLFSHYLRDFRNCEKPDAYIKHLVTTLVNEHARVQDASDKKMIDAGCNPGDRMPRRWYVIEPVKGDKVKSPLVLENKKVEDRFMSFTLQYLVSTGEFSSFIMLDFNDLLQLYFEFDAGEKGERVGFFGFSHKTIVLKCTYLLPNKEAMKILQQFLDFYKNRNILLYADNTYHSPMTVTTRKDKGGFETYSFGESLAQVLKQRNDFLNITAINGTKKG